MARSRGGGKEGVFPREKAGCARPNWDGQGGMGPLDSPPPAGRTMVRYAGERRGRVRMDLTAMPVSPTSFMARVAPGDIQHNSFAGRHQNGGRGMPPPRAVR